jgi:hypothetical protein
MSYIDILTDDLFEKILNIRCDVIDNEINLLNIKLKSLKRKLNPLFIEYVDIDEDELFLSINYDIVSYDMPNYLFSNINDDNYIIIIRLYDSFFGEENGKNYISKKLFKPTYFDILIESLKAVNKTKDFTHTFLEGLGPISNNRIYDYAGIRPKQDINYYEFIMGS